MSKNVKILIGVLVAIAVVLVALIVDGKYGSGRLVKVRGAGTYGSASIVNCPEDSSKKCCKGTVDECRPLCKALPNGCWRTDSNLSRELKAR